MGPTPMGIIASTLAFINIFKIVGGMGFGNAHIKRISEGNDLGKCIGTFFTIKIFTTLLMVICILTFFYGGPILFGRAMLEKKYEAIFYVLLVSGIIGNFTDVPRRTFTAEIKIFSQTAIGLIQKFTNSILRIVVAISGLGVIFLAYANLAGVLIAFLIAFILFKRYPIKRFDRNLFISYKIFAIPSIFIGLTSLLSQNLDKVFIEFFTDSRNVGFYVAAMNIAGFLNFFGMSINSILFPKYSSLFSQKQINKIKQLANKVERYASVILFPLIFYIFYYSDYIIHFLFGKNFINSGPILKFLILSNLFYIISRPYGSLIVGIGQIDTALKGDIMVLIVNIFFNLLLIPKTLFNINVFGLKALGAAIALFIANLFVYLYYRFHVYKILKSRFNYHILITLINSSLAGGISCLLCGSIDVNDFLKLTFGFFVTIVLYLLIMIFTKELSKDDIQYIKNMLNLKLLSSYIGSEMREVIQKNDKKENSLY